VGTINPVPGSTDQVTYTAPLVVPGGAQSAQVHVTVQSVANPLEAASALVTISAATGSAVVTIITPRTPPTVPLGEAQSFQASVTGVSDTAVSWEVDAIPGGNASVGTITAGANDTALYTAPKQLPGNPMVAVTAVSNADPAATASLDVTLIKGQAASVAVSVEGCINTNAVVVNSTVQLTALVSNVPSQDVTWQVNKVTGGNSTIGTITPGGLYTAPAKLPSPATVVISAVSVDDPSAVGNQPLTISLAPVPVVKIHPSGPQSLQVGLGLDFTATVLGLTDTNVTWDVDGQPPPDDESLGYFSNPSSSGCVSAIEYVAPATIPVPNPITVTAVASDGSTTSMPVPVTITPGPQYTLTLDPSGEVFVMVGQQQPYCAMDSDASDTVTWSVSGSSCAGAACGTIVPGVPNSQCSNLPAVYTAPPNVPTPVPTVTVTVSSVKHAGLNATDEVFIQGAAVPSISITPSSQTVAAGSDEIAFSAVIQNYDPAALVEWELGCISDWNGEPGEDCNDNDHHDGDGPGCIQIPNGKQHCGESQPLDAAGNLPLTYTSPQLLFTNDFKPNQCSGQNNDGNGYVQLTVTLQASGCFQNVCTATACVKVTP